MHQIPVTLVVGLGGMVFRDHQFGALLCHLMAVGTTPLYKYTDDTMGSQST